MGMNGSGNAYIINDEPTKSLTFGTDATSRLSIKSSGLTGINQNNPQQLLHLKQLVANKALRIEHQSTTDFWDNGIGISTNNYKFYYNGLFRADISSIDGAYTQASDLRLKKNIESISSVLDKVVQLNPSKYNFTESEDNTPKSIGFIAQEVENLFPELMRESDDGYKGLVYDGFAVLAIKAIQEQQELIVDLQNQIDELKRR